MVRTDLSQRQADLPLRRANTTKHVHHLAGCRTLGTAPARENPRRPDEFLQRCV